MKKITLLSAVFLLALSGAAFAQCTQADIDIYIENAKTFIEYPDFFGAATEYSHAADCFSANGQDTIAAGYYIKTAEHYLTAADNLVEGGDHFQKAKSVELAADAYSRAGDEINAEKYYLKSAEIYHQYGYYDYEAAVLANIAEEPKPFDWNSMFPIVIAAAVIAAVALAYTFLKDRQFSHDISSLEGRVQRDESRIREDEKVIFSSAPSAPKHDSYKPGPSREDAEKQKQIREKYADKLRHKYM
ncbi:MAG: hypothetical protein V1911_00470 [Candidatus Micrarchaeota archaeon]